MSPQDTPLTAAGRERIDLERRISFPRILATAALKLESRESRQVDIIERTVLWDVIVKRAYDQLSSDSSATSLIPEVYP